MRRREAALAPAVAFSSGDASPDVETDRALVLLKTVEILARLLPLLKQLKERADAGTPGDDRGGAS